MNDLDVREIREKTGLTQGELADRKGTSYFLVRIKNTCTDLVHI